MAMAREDYVVGDIVVGKDGVLNGNEGARRRRSTGYVVWVIVVENTVVV